MIPDEVAACLRHHPRQIGDKASVGPGHALGHEALGPLVGFPEDATEELPGRVLECRAQKYLGKDSA